MKQKKEIEFYNKANLLDKHGTKLCVGDKIVYASGSKSWVRVHVGHINRITSQTAFMIDEEGVEVRMSGPKNRRLKISDD